MRKGYRQSKNVIDKTGASFSEKAANTMNQRVSKGMPNPLTYKEPLDWQHDDYTDDLNFKTARTRPNNKVPGKGFITDNLVLAKNRKLGTKPMKKLSFMEPTPYSKAKK